MKTSVLSRVWLGMVDHLGISGSIEISISDGAINPGPAYRISVLYIVHAKELNGSF